MSSERIALERSWYYAFFRWLYIAVLIGGIGLGVRIVACGIPGNQPAARVLGGLVVIAGAAAFWKPMRWAHKSFLHASIGGVQWSVARVTAPEWAWLLKIVALAFFVSAVLWAFRDFSNRKRIADADLLQLL